ncbi:MAG TPA: ABC transporter ATP-binding protein [Bryobacteraceae bacterium]|jgi:ABC-type polysaccharide/polyol phosphate transport system ATPase subunit|nr:ABC transporter ATP-binding protein [Bryobacteraceae bacterium]
MIELRNVSKSFHVHGGRRLLRDYLSQTKVATRDSRFWALRDVSFSVDRGESLALIGRNGAGKSTALTLITGLTAPDSGTVRVVGRISPLLQLGAGFHTDLTGKENLYLNAAILGMHRKDVIRLFDTIVEYAGVGEFMDQPLRTYSSGMTLRLAFAIAIHIDPEVLLVDEVLAVGDASFRDKCRESIERLQRKGASLLLVTHELSSVKSLCDRVVWLNHGEVVLAGTPGEVLPRYEEALHKPEVYAAV